LNATEQLPCILERPCIWLGPIKGGIEVECYKLARQSGCPKKLAEALNTVPGAEGVGTQVPHLEGEEIFGSTKPRRGSWTYLLAMLEIHID